MHPRRDSSRRLQLAPACAAFGGGILTSEAFGKFFVEGFDDSAGGVWVNRGANEIFLANFFVAHA
jgi:hypothetical protein